MAVDHRHLERRFGNQSNAEVPYQRTGFAVGPSAHVRGGRFILRRLWRDDAGTTAIEFAFIALGLDLSHGWHHRVLHGHDGRQLAGGGDQPVVAPRQDRLRRRGSPTRPGTDHHGRGRAPRRSDDRHGQARDHPRGLQRFRKPHQSGHLPGSERATATPTIRANGPTSTATASRMVATASAPAATSSSTRITYPWQVMTPLIGNIVGDDGIIDLMAYSVVKNEPY